MINSLQKAQRPFVVFDPSNKDHRRYFKKFMATSTWYSCPYQWLIDDHSTDVVSYINRKLLAHYVKFDDTLATKRKTAKLVKLNPVKVSK